MIGLAGALALAPAVAAQPADPDALYLAADVARVPVTAGITRSFPPYYVVDEESGEVAGFTIDFLAELERRAQIDVTYRVFDTWPDAMQALRDGEIDMLPNLAISDSRAEFALFSVPISTTSISLFVRSDGSAVRSLDDLAGRPVAVVDGNMGQRLLRNRTDVQVLSYGDFSGALVALLSGRVDGMVFPKRVTLTRAEQIGVSDRIKAADEPVQELRRAVAVRIDAPEIAAAVHAAVAKTVRSEAYQELYAEWFGAPKSYWTVERLSWATGAALVIVIVGMAAWRYASVVKLNRRQRETLARLQATMEELMLAKEEAQLANRAKDTFLAHMSHELRTPLNSILGFSECISNEIFGKVGHRDYLEYSRYIHDAGGHLLSLINDLLDISKIEAGQQTIHEELICVGETVSRCVEMVRGRALQSKIRISADVPEEMPRLFADPRVCKQIVLNLLSNAVKFTPEGGEVTVGAGSDNGSVWMQVRDTGCGIPAEQIPEIMKPFRQVEDPLVRRHEGTGLGLCLVDNLIKMHGGTIDIDSTLGKGTTVTVRFPPERTRPLSDDDRQPPAKRHAA